MLCPRLLCDQQRADSLAGKDHSVFRSVHPVSYTHLDVYKRQIINDELIELVVEKNFIKIKSKEKEYSLLINKEENYRFLEICRNIVLVNKNSKIVFIIPERAFKDITEKEQFLNEIKLKIEI